MNGWGDRCMTIEIQELYHSKYAEPMQQIYKSVGWNKHTVDNINQIYKASSHVAIAFRGEAIVGFGRALSDGVFNGAIYDIVVYKDEQGKGMAKENLNSLLNQMKSVSCIHLISTIGNEDFYKKCGFRTLKTGMARYLSDELAEIYLNNEHEEGTEDHKK